ncbi:MAG: ATP-binding cassette domain-containing protein [Defluviicoccus sp.]
MEKVLGGDPLVELNGISKHFGEGETRVDALCSVTLEVASGEVVGLLGPSGSGKTTLLNVIGAVLEPNEGSMRLDGEVVYDNRWLRRDLRRLRLDKIGFIFQNHNLLPFLNAADNVAVVLQLAGLPREEGVKRSEALLDYLQVGHRKQAMPSQLSGGEAQRVAIARALATGPGLSWRTSQRQHSTPSVPGSSWTSSADLPSSTRRQSSLSPTMRKSSPGSTGSFGSGMGGWKTIWAPRGNRAARSKLAGLFPRSNATSSSPLDTEPLISVRRHACDLERVPAAGRGPKRHQEELASLRKCKRTTSAGPSSTRILIPRAATSSGCRARSLLKAAMSLETASAAFLSMAR